ncbi:MAG: DUF2577 domain-containing protein [Oscillospiraceae bacterium]|nr:DUF2577 domain-containing protein [Oscillospiraceae bacterium]
MPGELLVDIINKAAQNGIPQSNRTDLLFGRVTKTNPLNITVQNEKEYVLTEQFLLLSPWCKEQTITISNKSHKHTIPANSLSHTHTVDVAGTSHSHTIQYYSNASHRHRLSENPEVWTPGGIDDVIYMPQSTGDTTPNGSTATTDTSLTSLVSTNNATAGVNLSASLGGEDLAVNGNTITLNPGLATGDKVLMLRYANGQKFYVLHKV